MDEQVFDESKCTGHCEGCVNYNVCPYRTANDECTLCKIKKGEETK